MASATLVVDPLQPLPDHIAAAAGIIRAGGVVVCPTTGLYGLAADAWNPAAVERVFSLKRRPRHKPLSVLVAGPAALEPLVRRVPKSAAAVMARFWPGGVTLVLPASAALPPALTAGSGSIGVRQPSHAVAAALVAAVGGPVTATSANLSGEPGCAAIAALAHGLREGVDLVLDAGPLAGGAGSTVVDFTVDPPRILREGAVEREALAAFLC